ncbi:hypothetical protein [Synechococcus sp. PCC 6312]|uniref:hypothetical protein n=1 Tax=Synechococcus sp. (strain ATCC 27167 / PCC 6312) TaxID=195253 RepID=UPI00029EE560|nr:hypothetical protein [Synechococcus sp. PCC 6312]AFY61917.1 hypothetical protein Syn6312_2849 [Synechococcus sp. PCC 6312]
MSNILTIENISIVMVVQRYNPATLTSDFLQYSGIVPAAWELARQPICTPQVSQIVFQNGVSFVAWADKIALAQPLNHQEQMTGEVAASASRFVQALPNLDYQQVGINPRCHVRCDAYSPGGHEDSGKTFLASGDWQKCGGAPAKIVIQLGYQLEGRELNIAINQGHLENGDGDKIPVLLFSGNFNYRLSDNNSPEKINSIVKIIDQWQSDVAIYRDVIETMPKLMVKI